MDRQRIGAAWNWARGNVVLGKLERNNSAGAVKDRPALPTILRVEQHGESRPGHTLIEATSGNTDIALAMAAAIKGYRMVLIMPEDLSVERAQTVKAFGAKLVLTPKSGCMECARDRTATVSDKRESVRGNTGRARRLGCIRPGFGTIKRFSVHRTARPHGRG